MKTILGLAVMAALGAAHAEGVTYSFEASLTQDPFGLSHVGAPVSGRYTFDPAAPDAIADPGSGSFTSVGPAFGFSAQVDGMTYAVSGAINIGTQPGQPGLYLVTGHDGELTLELVLQDTSGHAVPSDALPLAAPRLSDFAVREFRLFAPDAEFTATLNALQSAVPEPATAALLLAGLAACVRPSAARRARRSSPDRPEGG